jgi:hypothetical protein
VQFRLGFGETNKTKGSSKKPNLKEKTPSLFLGFARLEQLDGQGFNPPAKQARAVERTDGQMDGQTNEGLHFPKL